VPRPPMAGGDEPVGSSDDAREELVARLLDLLATPHMTGGEGPLADRLERRYRDAGEVVRRIGNSLVVGGPEMAPSATDATTVATDRTGALPRPGSDARPLVLLVGHIDVVPPTDDDRTPRLTVVEGRVVIVGRGASDMQAGNVVAMRTFEDTELRARSPYELALVLYAGEEGPAEGNELRSVLQSTPWLLQAVLAIVLEPTDGQVELGCLGSLHAQVRFRGRQAHSARPWHGRNALTMAGELLAELDRDHVRDVEVDGIAYRDVWSATQAWTDGFGPDSDPAAPPFRNVIPATFTLNLNLRFAPSRDLAAAEEELRDRVGTAPEVEVEVVDRAPPAPPHRHVPVVAAFLDAVDAPLAGKQAWTDVARFAEVDVPALNFGPGLTAQAHQRGEFVPIDALLDADERLRRFLDPEVQVDA
jgi:succinyl-diaminopimelate desuccinylase